MKKILLSIVILTSLFLLNAHYALAQTSTALSISPPVIEVLIAPNKKVSQTFNLKYQGSNLNIIPEIHLAEPTDANGHVNIDPTPLTASTTPLVVTAISHPFGVPFEATGGNIPITLSFEAPTTDVPVDVYLALVLKAASKDQLTTSTVTTPGISALILVSINPSGVVPIDLEIQDFAPPYVHDSWLPLTIKPVALNKSPIMIRPEGKYEIISPSGKTVLSMPLYPNLILGNSSRNLLASNKDLPPLTLSWSPSWTNIGPYRLHLTLTTLGGTKLTDVEKVIWILPIRGFILLMIALIMAILYIVVIPRRKLNKKNSDLNAETDELKN